MAPTPKPPGQRRRRNADAPQWRQLPSEGSGRVVPAPRTDVEWGSHAKAYWEALWGSPMASTFTDVDEFALTRLCSLVDRRERAESGEHEVLRSSAVDGEVTVVRGFDGDAEIRQLEDRFGISPLARRRLQWEIEQAGGKERRETRPKMAEVRRLRTIDASG